MNKKQVWMFVGLIVLVFALFFIINLISGNNNQTSGKSTTKPSGSQSVTTNKPTSTPSSNSSSGSSTSKDESLAEKMIAPVDRTKSYNVVRRYYDSSLEEDEQLEAIMVYVGSGYTSYIASTGTSFEATDTNDFNVVSVFSGKVVDVRENPLLNTIVTVEHSNGVVVTYYSLQNVSVKINDKITQGQKIGTSSASIFDSSLSSHVYIEVTKDGQYVNPEKYIGKMLSDIK